MWALLGAMLATTSPALGAEANVVAMAPRAAELHGEPAPSSAAEEPPNAEVAAELHDEPAPSAAAEEPPSTEDTVEVRDKRKTPQGDAHRAPEGVHIVEVDAATPPSTSVADALEDVPGVSVRRLGGTLDPAFVRIRGSTARQVAVYLDGMPLNAFGTSAVDLSEFALFGFDRLEVYRGFTPAHLGGFSIGGAVNLVTDPAREVPLGFSAGTGSWTERRASGLGGVSGDLPDGARGQARAFVGYVSTAGDYDAFSHNGTIYNRRDDRIEPRGNNQAERFSGHVGLRARGTRFEASLWDLASWKGGGVAGAYYTQTTEAHTATAQNILHGQLTLRPSAWLSVTGDLGWQYRWEQFQDPLAEVGTGRQDLRGDFHGLAGSVAGDLRPTPWFEVQASARFNASLFSPRDMHEPPEEDTRVRFAPQLGLDARLFPWGDTLELRASIGLLMTADTHLAHEADPTRGFVDGMPGFALAFRPWDWLTVRAAVARGVRPPTFLELFGDRGTAQGNPLLRPETSTQVDGGLRVRGEPHPLLGGALEASGFLLDTTDLIVFVPNAQRVAVPINLGATRVAGIEAHAEGRLLRHVEVNFGLTGFLQSEILEAAPGLVGNRVPNIPAWQLDLNVAAYHGEYVRIGWQFTYTSGTFDSPSNFFEQAPRPLHGLTVRAQPGPLWPWIALELTNVANTIVATQYRNPHDPQDDDRTAVALQDFRGHPLPGRGVMVTLGWSPNPPALLRQAHTTAKPAVPGAN